MFCPVPFGENNFFLPSDKDVGGDGCTEVVPPGGIGFTGHPWGSDLPKTLRGVQEVRV